MSYETWMKANAPTWLQDKFGGAWLGGIGASLDDYLQQYISGALAAFPDYAPADALAAIGDELGIDRGPTETDLSYAARLRAAWIYWQLAGTPVGLLTALYFAGFPGAVIAQQNGLAYNLSANPTPGVDPTPLVVVTPTAALDVPASPVAPSTKVIPIGTTWWAIDSLTDFCSRFQILFPGPVFPSTFATYATATFSATSSAAVTWNNTFPDTTYHIECGLPTGGAVTVYADGTTKTTTGVTIAASGAFTGTADVLAWQDGANPLADPHPNDLIRLQSVVRKWRPAKSTCEGVYVCTEGKFAAWPVSTMANMLGVPSTIAKLSGSY